MPRPTDHLYVFKGIRLPTTTRVVMTTVRTMSRRDNSDRNRKHRSRMRRHRGRQMPRRGRSESTADIPRCVMSCHERGIASTKTDKCSPMNTRQNDRRLHMSSSRIVDSIPPFSARWTADEMSRNTGQDQRPRSVVYRDRKAGGRTLARAGCRGQGAMRARGSGSQGQILQRAARVQKDAPVSTISDVLDGFQGKARRAQPRSAESSVSKLLSSPLTACPTDNKKAKLEQVPSNQSSNQSRNHATSGFVNESDANRGTQAQADSPPGSTQPSPTYGSPANETFRRFPAPRPRSDEGSISSYSAWRPGLPLALFHRQNTNATSSTYPPTQSEDGSQTSSNAQEASTQPATFSPTAQTTSLPPINKIQSLATDNTSDRPLMNWPLHTTLPPIDPRGPASAPHPSAAHQRTPSKHSDDQSRGSLSTLLRATEHVERDDDKRHNREAR